MYNEELYKQALDYWGYEAQVDMCVEESSELIQALCKYKRAELNTLEESKAIRNVAEEIADVEIMLEQMKLLFGVYEQVEMEKDFKLSRLRERLSDAKEM